MAASRPPLAADPSRVTVCATAPVSLAVIGAPGCDAHIDGGAGFVTSLFLTPNPSNALSVPLAIPNSSAFLTLNFHGQTLTLVPNANPIGLQASNGVCANVGN